MKKIESLADAFHFELQCIYSSEQQLVKILLKMVKKARCERLSLELTEHLEQTKLHVERVASAFADTGKTAKAKKIFSLENLQLQSTYSDRNVFQLDLYFVVFT